MRFHQTAQDKAAQSADLNVGFRKVEQDSRIALNDEDRSLFKEERKLDQYRFLCVPVLFQNAQTDLLNKERRIVCRGSCVLMRQKAASDPIRQTRCGFG